jgi:hypothetical protein
MEFEELQSIWGDQNDGNLFTINKEALYAQIREQGESVNHKLKVNERLMFVGNLLIGIVLLVDAVRGNGATYDYILPAMYIFFSIGTLILRQRRQNEEVQFDQTKMGELHKALWQIDYLIKRSRSMMIWYLFPLMLVLTITLWLNSQLLWALGTLLVVAPLTYFGGQWEINKWYMPQKIELEALRKELES